MVATLTYPNGALGTFITSTGIKPGTNRLEIATDKGSIIVENSTKLTIKELDTTMQDLEKDPNTACLNSPDITEIVYNFPAEKLNRHSIMLNAFAGKILRGEKLYAEGWEGINSLTLSNAMYLSSWTNSVIQLPMDEELFYEELKKRIATSKHKEVEAVFAGAPEFNGGAKK